jgi:hypothetical protein
VVRELDASSVERRSNCLSDWRAKASRSILFHFRSANRHYTYARRFGQLLRRPSNKTSRGP